MLEPIRMIRPCQVYNRMLQQGDLARGSLGYGQHRCLAQIATPGFDVMRLWWMVLYPGNHFEVGFLFMYRAIDSHWLTSTWCMPFLLQQCLCRSCEITYTYLHQTRYIDMVPAYLTWVLLASLFVLLPAATSIMKLGFGNFFFANQDRSNTNMGVKMCIDPCTMHITRERFLDCAKLVIARFPDLLLCMGWASCWPALGCKSSWQGFMVYKYFQQGIWWNGKHLMFKTYSWWKTSCTTWDALKPWK